MIKIVLPLYVMIGFYQYEVTWRRFGSDKARNRASIWPVSLVVWTVRKTRRAKEQT